MKISYSSSLSVVWGALCAPLYLFSEAVHEQCPAGGESGYNDNSFESPRKKVARPDTLIGEVPVVDVEALVRSEDYSVEEWNKAAANVSRACRDWGFFQAVNHGIRQELLDDVITKGRELFSLPKTEKAKIKRTRTNARGWYDDELTKQTRDWKEGLDIGHVPAPGLPADHPSNVVIEGYNQWPESLPDFKETMDAFYSGAARVAEKLLEGIASHLGLPRRQFASDFEPHTSFLRLNYYPPCPEPCDYLSVNRHTDAGALTVLLQETGTTALQVNHRDTGQWVSIAPMDGALTINVGDMLQVWTNDLFIAPEHRVLSQPDRDRLSAPFFYNPAYHAEVAPLPPRPSGTTLGYEEDSVKSEGRQTRDAVPEQGASRYRPINWRDFRLRRFAGDYADQGDEEGPNATLFWQVSAPEYAS